MIFCLVFYDAREWILYTESSEGTVKEGRELAGLKRKSMKVGMGEGQSCPRGSRLRQGCRG
jgi:hypothetical protein